MAPGFQDPDLTVFVSNIDSRVTEEILWELFLQAGPLKNVHIPTDRGTGKKRTFGFVTFCDESAVPFSCELFNTLKLFNRSIYCKATNDSSKQQEGSSGSKSDAHSPIVTPNRPPGMAEDSPGWTPSYDQRNNGGRRDYYDNNRHSDHQRGAYDHCGSPHERAGSSRYGSSGRDSPRGNNDDHSRYDDRGRVNHGGNDRRYGDNRGYNSGNRGDNYGNRGDSYNNRSVNNSPMFMQAVDQLRHATSSFGSNPLNFGPQRDDLIPRHRQNRRRKQNPY